MPADRNAIIALLMFLTLGALMSCSADAPKVESDGKTAPASAGVLIQQVYNGYSPEVTVVDLKDGRKLVAFGHYNQAERFIVIGVDPDRPTQVLYSPAMMPVQPVNPPVTLLPVVTNVAPQGKP